MAGWESRLAFPNRGARGWDPPPPPLAGIACVGYPPAPVLLRGTLNQLGTKEPDSAKSEIAQLLLTLMRQLPGSIRFLGKSSFDVSCDAMRCSTLLLRGVAWRFIALPISFLTAVTFHRNLSRALGRLKDFVLPIPL